MHFKKPLSRKIQAIEIGDLVRNKNVKDNCYRLVISDSVYNSIRLVNNKGYTTHSYESIEELNSFNKWVLEAKSDDIELTWG